MLAWGTEAYHGEIGREATASTRNRISSTGAYHGEIGREATAHGRHGLADLGAYHGEIGREATACRCLPETFP